MRLTLRKHAYSNILNISPPKKLSFQIKNSDIFHISAQNIDCWYSLEPPRRGGSNAYSLEPPRRGGSNAYLQSMFLSRNKNNNVYPCKPHFYYIKVGFKGVNIIQACFHDEMAVPMFKVIINANHNIFLYFVSDFDQICVKMLSFFFKLNIFRQTLLLVCFSLHLQLKHTSVHSNIA